MLESILSYANDHAWARWAFVLFLFAPPIIISAVNGERGFAPLSTIIGWFALLFILAWLIS